MKNPQVYANFIFKLEDASDKFLQSKTLSKNERDSVDIFTILNDIIEFKKPHPCGGKMWKVKRTGVDFKLECTTCGRIIMITRLEVMKRIKQLPNN